MNQLEGEAAVTLRFPGEGGYHVFSGCFAETFSGMSVSMASSGFGSFLESILSLRKLGAHLLKLSAADV